MTVTRSGDYAARSPIQAPRHEADLARVLRRLSFTAGALGATTAAVGFSGWLGPQAWQQVLEAGQAMVSISPNTALCQFTLGLACVLLATRGRAQGVRGIAVALAVLASSITFLTVVDNVAGHALRVDHWLVVPPDLTCPRGNGHMSPITALALLAQGAGFLLVVRRRTSGPAVIGLLGMLLGWMIVTGYIADAPLFYGGPTIPVAFLTGVGLTFNGLSLLALAGVRGWPLRLLAGDSSRAVLLRVGVPWLTLLLVAFEIAIGVAFRLSGPLRAYGFAGVVIVATVIDFALMVRVGGYIGATLDRLRDEQHQLAERLRYRKKLEAIGTFASGAAHEINNPLQQIMSCAELILDAEPGDPHIPLHARAMLEASHHAATVTHRLLAHATVDPAPPAPVRLVDVVTQTLALAAKSLERAGVRVSLSVPVELPPIVCRRGQLSQALLGVLVNAREALDARFPEPHPSKILDVRAEPYRYEGVDVVRLTIADHGCGIPAAIRERVFEPFFTTKPREQGAGLGLWVAEAVVRELGGQVTIDSTEGEGTRVFLDLPIGPPDAHEPEYDGDEVLR